MLVLFFQNLLIQEQNGQNVFTQSEIKHNVVLVGLFPLLKFFQIDGVLKLMDKLMKFYHLKI